MIKPILLKDRDMIVNKARLNDFMVEVKEKYFKYYIEPHLKQIHIDKWYRSQIIINIEMFASGMKDLYYEYDKMSLNEYLAKIGWDAWINIFKNDFDEKDNRKGLGE